MTKKKGWQFNWTKELKQNDREIYKLTIVNNPTVIQGLVSLTTKADNVFMHLVESAPLTLDATKFTREFQGI